MYLSAIAHPSVLAMSKTRCISVCEISPKYGNVFPINSIISSWKLNTFPQSRQTTDEYLVLSRPEHSGHLRSCIGNLVFRLPHTLFFSCRVSVPASTFLTTSLSLRRYVENKLTLIYDLVSLSVSMYDSPFV